METALAQKTDRLLGQCTAMLPNLLGLPERSVWIDYDKKADVLYMSFRRPQRATRTVEVDEDILVRTNGAKIVGITIMNASTHQE